MYADAEIRQGTGGEGYVENLSVVLPPLHICGGGFSNHIDKTLIYKPGLAKQSHFYIND